MRIAHTFALLVSFAITACGGGGDTPCTPITGPAKIVMFGDSTTRGVDGANPAAYVATIPAQLLQDALDAEFGIGATLVIDRSVPGSSAADLLAGQDYLNQPWPQPVTGTGAHLVVIAHAQTSLLQGVTADAFAKQLDALIGETTVPVLVQTPSPITQAPFTAAMPAFVDAMKAVAARHGAVVIDVYDNDKALPGLADELPDGLHPTQTLYAEQVSSVVAPAVIREVRALQCAQ